MKGKIIKSTGSWYHVLSEGNSFECKLKGNFKIKETQFTNPLAVGDNVEFEWVEENKVGLIHKIESRQNYIIRKAVHPPNKYHIVASNIDQVVVVATLKLPRTSTGFMDRVLASADAYHIPAVIIFNKVDLYNEKDKDKLLAIEEIYKKIGYRTYITSALSGENMEAVEKLLKDKISVLIGHSGTGKSKIVNYIAPELALKTGTISKTHKKGIHTTTFAQMHALPIGGFIVDIPGLKEFGLVDFTPQDLAHYFPEMLQRIDKCRFSNCTHTNEPDCAIKIAVEKGQIHETRYKNYLNMIRGIL